MKKSQYTFIIGILISFFSCNQIEKKKEIQYKETEPVVEIKQKDNYQFVENDSITHFWESELKALTKKKIFLE